MFEQVRWQRALGGLGLLLLGVFAAMAVPPPARSAPFVYVTNAAGSTSVSQYAVGAGGLLSPLVPPAVPAGAIAEGVAVNPEGGPSTSGTPGATQSRSTG
jgi:hypothetical protein